MQEWWLTSRPDFALPIPVVEVGVPVLLALHRRAFDRDFVIMLAVALIIWWLAIHVGASLNCLGDYEGDRLDLLNKARFAHAVDRVGSVRLWKINLFAIGLITALICLLAIRLQRPFLLAFWLAGLALAIGYSFEPYKLKRRGLWGPLTVIVGCVLLPVLFAYHLFMPTLYATAAVIIGLYCLQCLAIVLAEQIADYDTDRAAGLSTFCVQVGRRRTCWLALLVYLCATGAMLLALSLAWPPVTGLHIVLLFCACICFAKFAFDVWRLALLSQRIEQSQDTPEVWHQTTALLKRRVTTPLWAVTAGLGIWIVVGGHLFR